MVGAGIQISRGEGRYAAVTQTLGRRFPMPTDVPRNANIGKLAAGYLFPTIGKVRKQAIRWSGGGEEGGGRDSKSEGA